MKHAHWHENIWNVLMELNVKNPFSVMVCISFVQKQSSNPIIPCATKTEVFVSMDIVKDPFAWNTIMKVVLVLIQMINVKSVVWLTTNVFHHIKLKRWFSFFLSDSMSVMLMMLKESFDLKKFLKIIFAAKSIFHINYFKLRW